MNGSVSRVRTARSTSPVVVIRPTARKLASAVTTGAISDRRNASSVALIGSVTAGRRGAHAIRQATAKTTVAASASRYPYPCTVIASAYRSSNAPIDITSPPVFGRFIVAGSCPYRSQVLWSSRSRQRAGQRTEFVEDFMAVG